MYCGCTDGQTHRRRLESHPISSPWSLRWWDLEKKSNASKLLCMSLFPARMKIIQSKMKGLEWSQHCSYYKSMFFFPDTQGQLTPQSMIGFWPNFELIRTLMVFILTCKNQEDPIKKLVYGSFHNFPSCFNVFINICEYAKMIMNMQMR